MNQVLDQQRGMSPSAIPWAERCKHVQRSLSVGLVAVLEKFQLPDTVPYYGDASLQSHTCPYAQPFNADSPVLCAECPVHNPYATMGWARKHFGMYALISYQHTTALAHLLQGKRVLEVMAGSGWLAYALRKHGIEVDATDDNSWKMLDNLNLGVRECEAERAAAESSADVLLMCWPPMDGTAPQRAARAWGSERPIVYIGEGRGGCCANDGFFKEVHLRTSDLRWPQWAGLHDVLVVGGLCSGTWRDTVQEMLANTPEAGEEGFFL